METVTAKTNALTIGEYTITLGNTPNNEPTLKAQKLITTGKNKKQKLQQKHGKK